MINKLIVVEGIDGVGKTTIAKLLQKELLKHKIQVIRYENYEDKSSGFNSIKPFVKKECSIDSSLFFYVSSAIYKSTIIQKLLKENWVICDRYIYSTLAYHKVRGSNLSLISHFSHLPIIFPNFHFLIKVDESIRINRIKMRKNSDKQDFKPKQDGNLVARMEYEMGQFQPIIIDNSDSNINNTVKNIIRLILN